MRLRQSAALLLCVILALVGFDRCCRVLGPEGPAGWTFIRRECWPSRESRILVVAPHPDDETLGGEMVLRWAAKNRVPARVVLVTCGDAYVHAAQDALGKEKASAGEMIHFGAMRRQETLHASRAMGLEPSQVVFLGFPDGGTMDLWNENWAVPFRSPHTNVNHVPYPFAVIPGAPYTGRQEMKELADEIRQFRPTDIYVSHQWDEHPDHAATCYFTLAALDEMQTEPWIHQIRVHPYLVHAGHLPIPRAYLPNRFVNPPLEFRCSRLPWSELRLSDGQARFRKNIIDLYSSQVALTRTFLEAFARRNVLFGDVPPFPIRSVSWGMNDADWQTRDRYYWHGQNRGRLKGGDPIVISQSAALTADVVLLRVRSTIPALGTACRVFVHPITPGASAEVPGTSRVDSGSVITTTIPVKMFGPQRRGFVSISLEHGVSAPFQAKGREIVLP